MAVLNLYVNKEIHIRLLEIQDAEELFQLVQKNRKYLRKWLPWVEQVHSSYQYHTIIPFWQKQFSDNMGFEAGIFFRNQLVGMISLQQVDWVNQQASIGYFLGEKFQGKGIMLASVKAAVNYAFYQLYLNRIEIRCGTKNKKSQAIPERLHFHKEGIIRDGEYLYDHFHDLFLYSMLAKEWSFK